MLNNRETVIITQTKIVPTKSIIVASLAGSALLAKLTLNPRHYKWMRRRDLCDNNSTSDWARMSQSSR